MLLKTKSGFPLWQLSMFLAHRPKPVVKCILFLLLAPEKSVLMTTIRQINSEASRWYIRKNFSKEADWKRIRAPESPKCLCSRQCAKAIVCSEATCQLELVGGGELTLRLARRVIEQDKHFHSAQVLFSSCCAIDTWKLLIRSLWRTGSAGMIQPIDFIEQSSPSEHQREEASQGSLWQVWVGAGRSQARAVR